jgi:hypothetical protein
MGKTRNTYKILAGQLTGRNHLEDVVFLRELRVTLLQVRPNAKTELALLLRVWPGDRFY